MWAKCSSYLHHHSTRPASKKNDGRLELCTLTYAYTYVLNLCHRRMQLCNTLTTLYIQYKVHGGAFDTPIKVIQIFLDPDTCKRDSSARHQKELSEMFMMERDINSTHVFCPNQLTYHYFSIQMVLPFIGLQKYQYGQFGQW